MNSEIKQTNPLRSIRHHLRALQDWFLPESLDRSDLERVRRIRLEVGLTLALILTYLLAGIVLWWGGSRLTQGVWVAWIVALLYGFGLGLFQRTGWQRVLEWLMFLIPLISYAYHSRSLGGALLPERLITFPLLMTLGLGLGWGIASVGALLGVILTFFSLRWWGIEIPVSNQVENNAGLEFLPLLSMFMAVVIGSFLETERHYNLQLLMEEHQQVQAAELERQLAETRRANEVRMLEQSQLVLLGESSASIAHEINNPLGFLQSQLELWQLKAQRGRLPPEEEFAASLKLSLQQVERITSITRHLRNFGRTDAGGQRVYSMQEPISGTQLLLSHSLRKAQVTLQVELAEDLPTLEGNPGQVEQVLLNLIGNARDALQEAAQGQIHLKVGWSSAQKTHLRIEVQDNGPGIPKEVQDQIFEPFFTTKPVGQGTGLGLSICQGLLRKMQSQLFCESTPGQGTRFYFDLPLTQEVTPTASASVA